MLCPAPCLDSFDKPINVSRPVYRQSGLLPYQNTPQQQPYCRPSYPEALESSRFFPFWFPVCFLWPEFLPLLRHLAFATCFQGYPSTWKIHRRRQGHLFPWVWIVAINKVSNKRKPQVVHMGGRENDLRKKTLHSSTFRSIGKISGIPKDKKDSDVRSSGVG